MSFISTLRMKHISHFDLDGFGGIIISRLLQERFPCDSLMLDVANIRSSSINDEIRATLDEIEKYDLIIITDLAINQNTVDLINNSEYSEKFLIFDHHKTSVQDLPANFTIQSNSPLREDKLTCGAELYYNHIINDRVYGLIYDDSSRYKLAYFIECVRLYDTYEFWLDRNKEDLDDSIKDMYITAQRLNTLFHILDKEEFIQYILNYIRDDSVESVDLTYGKFGGCYEWIDRIINIEQLRTSKYIESAIKRAVIKPVNLKLKLSDSSLYTADHSIAVIYAEKASPMIANILLERNPSIDICAIISHNQVSLYTNKEDIDVGNIAIACGGGGHKKASGFTISYQSANNILYDQFVKFVEIAAGLKIGSIGSTVDQ